MEFKGGVAAGFAGLWIADLTCNLVGVAVGFDIPNSVELVTEVSAGYGLAQSGCKAGAELDWRRRMDSENRAPDQGIDSPSR